MYDPAHRFTPDPGIVYPKLSKPPKARKRVEFDLSVEVVEDGMVFGTYSLFEKCER